MEVQFAPVVTIPRPRLQQALQYDMDLECHVEGYPPPTITWFKDEVQLMNNQHYRISKFRTSDEFTETTLRVVTIDQRHYGTFTCKAQNKLGTAAGQVELSEAIEPVCPPACGHHYLPAVLPLGELFMSLMSLKDSPIPDVNNTGLHQDPEINGSNKAPEIQES
ncbi:lachesin-like [Hyposmocoma kahamanoa]|uniref:lachesin-like n=1 Tax=Hyposmocoma kahamanoa TaxID=1477025 RepID=UPI000E6D6F6F|nr:lachesin-like [Hyposmocoma kahamanoa]